jgi:hypothetical protein
LPVRVALERGDSAFQILGSDGLVFLTPQLDPADTQEVDGPTILEFLPKSQTLTRWTPFPEGPGVVGVDGPGRLLYLNETSFWERDAREEMGYQLGEWGRKGLEIGDQRVTAIRGLHDDIFFSVDNRILELDTNTGVLTKLLETPGDRIVDFAVDYNHIVALVDLGQRFHGNPILSLVLYPYFNQGDQQLNILDSIRIGEINQMVVHAGFVLMSTVHFGIRAYNFRTGKFLHPIQIGPKDIQTYGIAVLNDEVVTLAPDKVSTAATPSVLLTRYSPVRSRWLKWLP